MHECHFAVNGSLCIYVVWIRYLKAKSVAKIYSGTLNSISVIGRANILSGHPDRVNISPGYVTLPITECAAKGQKNDLYEQAKVWYITQRRVTHQT